MPFIAAFIAVLLLTAKSWSQQSCTMQSGSIQSQQQRLRQIFEACKTEECKGTGSKTENVPGITFEASLFSTPSNVRALVEKFDQLANSRFCPISCEQRNFSVLEMKLTPAKPKEEPKCPGPKGPLPTEIKSPEFVHTKCSDTDSMARKWIQEVLLANNDVGRDIDALTPSACSYYSTQNIVTTNRGKDCVTYAVLRIQLGPVRSNREFKYEGIKVTQRWVCVGKDKAE